MIRVGPAGWSYADWEGIVYPRPKPRGFHGLAFLAQHFDCMEINSSFYSMPRREHAERWAALVEDRPEFRFVSKLNSEFTHGPELDDASHGHAVETFRAGIEPLRACGKLAAILVQFPVSFRATPTARARLERLLDAWSDLTVALELRHRSWFEDDHYQCLRSRRVTLLDIDLPSSPDHPPQNRPSTGNVGYLRLHGRNSSNWFRRDAGRDERYDYLYSPAELEPIVAKAKRRARQTDDVYVITGTRIEGQAIVNGLESQAALTNAPVTAPAELIARYPRLSSIARSRGQQRLF